MLKYKLILRVIISKLFTKKRISFNYKRKLESLADQNIFHLIVVIVNY